MQSAVGLFLKGGIYSMRDKALDPGLNDAQDLGGFRKAGSIE